VLNGSAAAAEQTHQDDTKTLDSQTETKEMLEKEKNVEEEEVEEEKEKDDEADKEKEKEDYVVDFVTQPSEYYSRMPNHHAKHRTFQMSEGAILFVYGRAKRWWDKEELGWNTRELEYYMTDLLGAYEGKTFDFERNRFIEYTDPLEMQEEPEVSPPSERELAVVKDISRRPVAFVLVATEHSPRGSEGYEMMLREMEEFVRTLNNKSRTSKSSDEDVDVRFYQLDGTHSSSVKEYINTLDEIAVQMVRDIQNGSRGIQTLRPQVLPWESLEKVLGFDKLQQIRNRYTADTKKRNKEYQKKRSLWGRVMSFFSS